MGNKCRAVFVDRDGVLNQTYPEGTTTRGPRTRKEVVILPGVYAACRALYDCQHHFIVVGVTNQPDVSRGLMTFKEAEAVSSMVQRLAWITAILPCYHDCNDNCYCRKPRPGLLTQAAAWYEIDLARSYMVGDRETDIEAGRRAGCTTIKIGPEQGSADHRADSLAAAVPWIIGRP